MDGLLMNILRWAELLLEILSLAAIVAFFWGIVKYIWSETDDDKVNGKNIMVWGMIALFVMVGIWSILGFFQESLGIDGMLMVDNAPDVKIVPGFR